MQEPWWSLYRITLLGLWIIAGVFVSLGFTRSRNKGFLLLFAGVVLWPILVFSLELVRRHFLKQVDVGQRPWLFPFSLMNTDEFSGWQMSPGEFRTKMMCFLYLLGMALFASGFMVLYRNMEERGS